MAEATATSIIFSPTRADLQTYYGPLCPAAKIDYILKCQEKIKRSTTAVLHVTTNADTIIRSGKLLMSAGGLGGCVYGIPVFPDGTIHNLGQYIIREELPMFLRNQHREAEIQSLLLHPSNITFGCVDYLSFGKHYKETYDTSKQLQKSIPDKEVSALFNEQYILASRLMDVLSADVNTRAKMTEVAESIENSYVIRMLYFEITLEYLFLFQDGEQTRSAKEASELSNRDPKSLIFSLNPELAIRFSLANFLSGPLQVDGYLQTHPVIPAYESDEFFTYLSNRMQFYIDRYLLSDQNNLIGHLIFRYFNERPRLELLLAKQLWQEAKAHGITAVTYRLPKGEIGLLPAANLKASFNGGTFDLELAGQMAIKHSVMRNPYAKEAVSAGRKVG